MYDFAILISGLSIVFSAFLLAILRRVSRRRRVRILSYMGGVFALILVSNVLFVLQVFQIIPSFAGYEVAFLLAVQLVILILFYAGIVRGIG